MITATLKLTCPDQKGLIAKMTSHIFKNKGNIVNLDQHTDEALGLFFMRLEWDLSGFAVPRSAIKEENEAFIQREIRDAKWELHFSDIKKRMAILVSKHDHCLYDLLIRHKSKELDCEIPLVISNHPDLENICEFFRIPFHHIPMATEAEKGSAEEKQLMLLKRERIDFVVLARYMQIVSSGFIDNFPNRIINIHHSFLPAFKGAKPYHQAYEKGVKIIGATSHYVTAELDQGPIIHQDVVHISHKDQVEDLVTKGKNIERFVLAEAVKLHVQDRIFVANNKTFIL